MKEVTVYDKDGNVMQYVNEYSTDNYIYISDELITKPYEVKFYNSKTSKAYVVSGEYVGGKLSAKIPDVLLQDTLPILGYVITEKISGKSANQETMLTFAITVQSIEMPSDYLFVTRHDYRMITDVYEDMKEYVDSSGGGGSDVEALSIDEIDRILV